MPEQEQVQAEIQKHKQQLATAREVYKEGWHRISDKTHSEPEAAVLEAQDKRPNDEFGFQSGFNRDQNRLRAYLTCLGEDCPKQRKVQQDHDGWHVYENDEEHGVHPPARSKAYKWTAEQKKLLDTEFSKGQNFSVNYFMRLLEKHELKLGCTDEDIRRLTKGKNKQLQRWARDDMDLATLQNIVDKNGSAAVEDEGKGQDEDEPYLLELADGAEYIIVGDAVDYH